MQRGSTLHQKYLRAKYARMSCITKELKKVLQATDTRENPGEAFRPAHK